MKIVNFITHSKLESALGYKKDYVTVRIMPDDFERFRTSFPGSGMRTTDSAVLMFSLNKDLVDYKYNGKSQTLPKRVKEGYFVGLIEKAREWAFQTPFVQGLRKTVGLTSNPPFYAHNLYEKKTHGLNLKQMRRLYAMVSRGNQKAITYARNVLGIPFSESPTQVKAVVYHHVRDLAERRVRRNPGEGFQKALEAKKRVHALVKQIWQSYRTSFGYKADKMDMDFERQIIDRDVRNMSMPELANAFDFIGKRSGYSGKDLVRMWNSRNQIAVNPARSHRERIAIDTVRHPMKGYFLGGPDLAESVRYLRSLGYSMAQLKKLNPEVEDILEGRKSILPNRRRRRK